MTQPLSMEPRLSKQRAAEARCDAMIRHARDQILAVGVDRFSLNEVIRLAGGSNATVAKYFGDRTGLIAAASGAEAAKAVAELDGDMLAKLPLEQALAKALETILRFYLRPGSIALYRAVISSATPDGASAFYNGGHTEILQRLAKLIECRKGREVKASVDSGAVADHLLHAIRAGPYERVLIGLTDALPDDADVSLVAAGVAAMMTPGLVLERS